MKSVITKRWYFIFLIALLSVHTYSLFESIIYSVPKGTKLLITLSTPFVWYCIIKKHRKLYLAIVVWTILMLLDMVFQIGYVINHLHEGKFLLKFCFLYLPFVILLVGGKMFIKIKSFQTDQLPHSQ